MLEANPSVNRGKPDITEQLKNLYDTNYKEHADKARIAGVFALTGLVHPVLSLIFLTEAFRQSGKSHIVHEKKLELYKASVD